MHPRSRYFGGLTVFLLLEDRAFTTRFGGSISGFSASAFFGGSWGSTGYRNGAISVVLGRIIANNWERVCSLLLARVAGNGAAALISQSVRPTGIAGVYALHRVNGCRDKRVWSRRYSACKVFGNLATKPLNDPDWGNTALQFNNQTEVARRFTEVMHNGTTDMPTLKSVIGSVTPATDVSTPDVIAMPIGVALHG